MLEKARVNSSRCRQGGSPEATRMLIGYAQRSSNVSQITVSDVLPMKNRIDNCVLSPDAASWPTTLLELDLVRRGVLRAPSTPAQTPMPSMPCVLPRQRVCPQIKIHSPFSKYKDLTSPAVARSLSLRLTNAIDTVVQPNRAGTRSQL